MIPDSMRDLVLLERYYGALAPSASDETRPLAHPALTPPTLTRAHKHPKHHAQISETDNPHYSLTNQSPPDKTGSAPAPRPDPSTAASPSHYSSHSHHSSNSASEDRKSTRLNS